MSRKTRMAAEMDSLIADAQPGETLIARDTGIAPLVAGELALTNRRLILLHLKLPAGFQSVVVPVGDLRSVVFDGSRTGATNHMLTVTLQQGRINFRFGTHKHNPTGERWRGLISDVIRANATPAVPRHAAPATPGPTDLAEHLERLAGLHATGALSDAEFAASKAKLLGHDYCTSACRGSSGARHSLAYRHRGLSDDRVAASGPTANEAGT